MSDLEHSKDVRCLAAIDEFAKYWQYYQSCRGQAFAKECREAAIVFFKELPNIVDTINFSPIELKNAEEVYSKPLNLLMQWKLKPDDDHVISEDGWADIESLRVSVLFGLLRTIFYKKLGLARVGFADATLDNLKLEEHLKWRGHLPKLTGGFDPDKLMAKAEKSPSIVIVGDIRRSQDLMTYSDNPIAFAASINTFISDTRRLLNKYGAIFDKFTGDGFVGYFNEEIGLYHRASRDDSFIGFVREYMPLMSLHLQNWKRYMRKLPDEPMGVVIGADLGLISFRVPEYHFIAVGQAIVWATRMASEAKAGEILVNNLLYEVLRQRNDVVLEQRIGHTKSGEGFLAWALTPKNAI